jgi:hypothetical protein
MDMRNTPPPRHTRRRPPGQRLRPAAVHLALCTGLCLALAGCAVGPVGTLAAQVERAGTVTTLDIYSVGLHLRTRADDPGAHLGLSRRISVFADDTALQPGWYLFAVPSPPQQALAQDLRTLGIDLSAQAPLAGLSIGYSHNRLQVRLPADASVYIAFARGGQRIVHITSCSETTPCTLPTHAH